MQMYINKYCNMPWATGGSSGSSGGGGSDPNIGLAVNNQFELLPEDFVLKSLIEEAGHTVHVFSDENIVPNTGVFEVIVLARSISSSNSANYVNIGTPILTLEPGGYDNMNITDDYLTFTDNTLVTPLAIGHPILDGLPTVDFNIYNDIHDIDVSRTATIPLTNAQTIVEKNGRPYLFIQLSGTLMYDGVTTATDNILAFGSGDNEVYLTPNGKQLFWNSLDWLINN